MLDEKRPGDDRGAGSIVGERRERTAKLADVKTVLSGLETDVIRALGFIGLEFGWDEGRARWICTCGNGDLKDFPWKMRDHTHRRSCGSAAGV